MLKTKLAAIILLFAGMVFINSCSDDDDSNPINPPTVGENFFKATVGDTWTYESFDIPEATGEIDQSSRIEYTVTITGKETIEAREAYIYKFDGDGYNRDKHFIPNGKKLESLVSDILPVSLPFELPVPQSWVTIADLTQNSWDIYSLNLTNLPINYEAIKAVLTGTLKITGTLKEESTLTVSNKDYKVRRIEIKYNVSGNAMIEGLPTAIPVSFDLVGNFYYAEGIGLLKNVFPSQKVTLSAISLPVDGYQDNCISLNVK
jgi:hypothetical protein